MKEKDFEAAKKAFAAAYAVYRNKLQKFHTEAVDCVGSPNIDEYRKKKGIAKGKVCGS